MCTVGGVRDVAGQVTIKVTVVSVTNKYTELWSEV